MNPLPATSGPLVPRKRQPRPRMRRGEGRHPKTFTTAAVSIGRRIGSQGLRGPTPILNSPLVEPAVTDALPAHGEESFAPAVVARRRRSSRLKPPPAPRFQPPPARAHRSRLASFAAYNS